MGIEAPWRLNLQQGEVVVRVAHDGGPLRCPEQHESRSRFTALFEAVVIDWLQEASTAAVAQQLGLIWDDQLGSS